MQWSKEACHACKVASVAWNVICGSGNWNWPWNWVWTCDLETKCIYCWLVRFGCCCRDCSDVPKRLKQGRWCRWTKILCLMIVNSYCCCYNLNQNHYHNNSHFTLKHTDNELKVKFSIKLNKIKNKICHMMIKMIHWENNRYIISWVVWLVPERTRRRWEGNIWKGMRLLGAKHVCYYHRLQVNPTTCE